tara:strand:+ start:76 stop:414 length:339 start_codon:yes stop_codon:yes gene_type:complete
MKEYKGIDIPTTGNDWQLYTSSYSCGEAARKLTVALKKAMRFFNKGLGGNQAVPNLLGDAWRIVENVQREYSQYGATDTEPSYVGQQTLINYAKLKLYGHTDGYHPELGDCM